MLPLLLLGFELIMFYLLYKKFGIANGIVIVFLIVFFYCNSVVVDVLLFNNVYSSFRGAVQIHSENIAFDLTCISYFLFLFVYFICFKFFYTKKPITLKYLYRVPNWLVVLFVFILALYILRNSATTREEIKGTGSFIMRVLYVSLMLFYIFLTFSATYKSKILKIIVNIAFILFCIFSYEREPIVLLFMILLFKYKHKINLKYAIPLGGIGVVVLSYFKAFYVILLSTGNTDAFFAYVNNNPIVLSNLDPLPSFTLIYDYFRGVMIYDRYDYSYITSLVNQIPIYFGNAREEISYGQKASNYYVSGDYGVAFSMILESLLNFSYFGPIFLAIVSLQCYRFLMRMYYKFPELINILFIMFFLSFIRTEFIVIFKVYIFPFIVFLSVLSVLVNLYKNRFIIKPLIRNV